MSFSLSALCRAIEVSVSIAVMHPASFSACVCAALSGREWSTKVSKQKNDVRSTMQVESAVWWRWRTFSVFDGGSEARAERRKGRLKAVKEHKR
jgi:hypothetical protein